MRDEGFGDEGVGQCGWMSGRVRDEGFWNEGVGQWG